MCTARPRRIDVWFAAVIAIALLAATGLQAAPTKARGAKDSGKIGMVIVYAGGPDSPEVKKLIDQLLTYVAQQTGIDPANMTGAYFNDAKATLDHLKANRDSFILGSLGLYLSQRKALSLLPLAKLRYAGDGEERYYLMVRKGRYHAIEELKGKTLSGNTLFEDHRFLSRVVFGGRLDVPTYFDLKPTGRPLSAVKKVAADEMDAVLLNQVQYESLVRIPLADKVETIFTSEPMPPLGFMVLDTPKTRPVKDKVLKAVTDMCASTDGKAVCNNFGISGFDPLQPGVLDAVTRKYEGAAH